MREYTAEELQQLSMDQLYDIKQVKVGELASEQNRRGKIINDILVLQQQINQVAEEHR